MTPDGKWFALSYCGNHHYPYDDIGIVSAKGGEEIINLTHSGYTDSLPQWVLGGNAILFISERYGMRNHASWGTLDDVMIIFLNRKAYEDFKLTKEKRELEKAVAGLDGSEKDKTSKSDNSKKDIDIELDNIEDRLERLTPGSADLVSASGKMVWDSKFAYLYVLGGKFSKMKDGANSLESIPVSTTMKMDLAAERAYMFNHDDHE